MLSSFLTCEPFLEKKAQSGNHFRRNSYQKREERILFKKKLAKIITPQKGRRNFKVSKVNNNYEVIILGKKKMNSFSATY